MDGRKDAQGDLFGDLTSNKRSLLNLFPDKRRNNSGGKKADLMRTNARARSAGGVNKILCDKVPIEETRAVILKMRACAGPL